MFHSAFHRKYGISCPSCGGMRAVSALLHGDVITAVSINPLAVPVFIFLCITPIWALTDAVMNRHTMITALTTPWKKIPTVVAIVIIVLNWLWNIQKGL